MIPLSLAETICSGFAALIKPATTRILIVGSIRRKKPEVNDGDIIYIPQDPNQFRLHLRSLANRGMVEMITKGSDIQRIKYGSMEIDLYRATQQTWGTLQLIRTGSKQFNIRTAQFAHTKGMQLKADGSGLIDLNKQVRIAVNHETDIFTILGIPFIPPEERN